MGGFPALHFKFNILYFAVSKKVYFHASPRM